MFDTSSEYFGVKPIVSLPTKKSWNIHSPANTPEADKYTDADRAALRRTCLNKYAEQLQKNEDTLKLVYAFVLTTWSDSSRDVIYRHPKFAAAKKESEAHTLARIITESHFMQGGFSDSANEAEKSMNKFRDISDFQSASLFKQEKGESLLSLKMKFQQRMTMMKISHGVEWTNEEQVLMFMDKMSDEHRAFVQSIRRDARIGTTDLPETVDILCNLAWADETESKKYGEETPVNAFLATEAATKSSGSTKGDRRRDRGKGRGERTKDAGAESEEVYDGPLCWECDSPEHLRADCPHYKRGAGRGGKKKETNPNKKPSGGAGGAKKESKTAAAGKKLPPATKPSANTFTTQGEDEQGEEDAEEDALYSNMFCAAGQGTWQVGRGGATRPPPPTAPRNKKAQAPKWGGRNCVTRNLAPFPGQDDDEGPPPLVDDSDDEGEQGGRPTPPEPLSTVLTGAKSADGAFGDTAILLDNQAAVPVFRNPRLLKRMRKVAELTLGGVNAHDVAMVLTKAGVFQGSLVYYDPRSAANILSLARLKDEGREITYDSQKDVFHVAFGEAVFAFTRWVTQGGGAFASLRVRHSRDGGAISSLGRHRRREHETPHQVRAEASECSEAADGSDGELRGTNGRAG
jgi:hypothetical protein